MRFTKAVKVRNIRIFGLQSKNIKMRLFYTALLNDLRYSKAMLPENRKLIEQIPTIINEAKPETTVYDTLVSTFYGETNFPRKDNPVKKTFTLNELFAMVLKEYQYIKTYITKDEISTALLINVWLYSKGLCPLLHFAFDHWYPISERKEKLASLFEISMFYLYRLIPTPRPYEDSSNPIVAEGGYSFIIKKGTDNSLVDKVPHNITALYYLNQQEAWIMRFLSKKKIGKYVPELIAFNPKTKIITRRFYKGKSGHELLRTGFVQTTPHAITCIKDFFIQYQAVAKQMNIHLDIHPGNFIWSASRNKFYFIDLGPIPKIGSEYYPTDNFENYFKKIWLERHQRIQDHPIRSVELLPPEVKHFSQSELTVKLTKVCNQKTTYKP